MVRNIRSLQCVGLDKKSHQLQVQVELTNGKLWRVYHKYSHLIELQNRLKHAFGRRLKGVPELPTMGILYRMFANDQAEKKIKRADEYLRALSKQPREVLEFSYLQEFFHPHSDSETDDDDDDESLSDDRKTDMSQPSPPPEAPPEVPHRRRVSEDLAGSARHRKGALKPRKSSDPYALDQGEGEDKWVVLEDYVPHSADKMAVKKGDVVVRLETLRSGWWYVYNPKTGEEGLVPVTYLRPPTPPKEAERRSNGTRCRVGENYSSGGPEELTVAEGQVVEVLSTSEDGWWLVKRGGDVGRVPATVLLTMKQGFDQAQSHGTHRQEEASASDKRVYRRIREIQRDRRLSNREAPPRRRTQLMLQGQEGKASPLGHRRGQDRGAGFRRPERPEPAPRRGRGPSPIREAPIEWTETECYSSVAECVTGDRKPSQSKVSPRDRIESALKVGDKKLSREGSDESPEELYTAVFRKPVPVKRREKGVNPGDSTRMGRRETKENVVLSENPQVPHRPKHDQRQELQYAELAFDDNTGKNRIIQTSPHTEYAEVVHAPHFSKKRNDRKLSCENVRETLPSYENVDLPNKSYENVEYPGSLDEPVFNT